MFEFSVSNFFCEIQGQSRIWHSIVVIVTCVFHFTANISETQFSKLLFIFSSILLVEYLDREE